MPGSEITTFGTQNQLLDQRIGLIDERKSLDKIQLPDQRIESMEKKKPSLYCIFCKKKTRYYYFKKYFKEWKLL